MTIKKPINKMWGGRYAAGPDAMMQAINASIGFDQRLAGEDIKGSLAHADMLIKQKIISKTDGEAIKKGLALIETEIAQGTFTFDEAMEDIHMNIEHRLGQLIGDAAGRLHTARSRNDQVATDFKLWTRTQCDLAIDALDRVIAALLTQAEAGIDIIMPGFTHLQIAQPITWGHHMMAYVEMFARDRSRFCDARERMNESPLGAGALAGTGFDIDRDYTADKLGFAAPSANSLDAVSDRDFALEFMASSAICAVHQSRLAEEIVLWASAPFQFITLSDKFSTGSSIMPQKKNPDAAELIRAKTGRINGAFFALLTVMKSLPLAYSKDMQEDKEQTFDCADTVILSLSVLAVMLGDITPQAERMRAVAEQGFSTATDLADWLVRELGMPFRQAHGVTGALVALAESRGCDLAGLSLEDMQGECADITNGVFDVLGVENSVKSRASYGGTAPVQVKAQIARYRSKLAKS